MSKLVFVAFRGSKDAILCGKMCLHSTNQGKVILKTTLYHVYGTLCHILTKHKNMLEQSSFAEFISA